MTKVLGLDKIKRFYDIIKFNGGVFGSLNKLWRTDELKIGTLVGKDRYGNQYFENKMYFYARNRWVEYSPSMNWDYDASQVPPEWHRWLHYMTDDPPTTKPPVAHKWIAPHVPNLSGSDQAYVPYSTTKPKIQAWVPPQKKV